MKKQEICHIFIILLLIMLCFCAGCTQEAQAAPDAVSQDWMTMDMSFVPDQGMDGIQIMEIRRQSDRQLEIAHVPVTGNETLNQHLVDQARSRMDAFEAATQDTREIRYFMMECAVTGQNEQMSVFFASQDSQRRDNGLGVYYTHATYDLATGAQVNPLSDWPLTEEIKTQLIQQSDNPVMSFSDAWTNAVTTKNGVYLCSYALGNQPEFAYLDRTFVENLANPAPVQTPASVAFPSDAKLVALTYDDGPCNNTGRLLDILAQYDVKCTFFLLGKNVAAMPDTVKRMVAEGHEVGNHTYSHENLKKIEHSEVRDQLDRTADAIENACGVRPTLLRPPYGATTYSLRDFVTDYPFIKWSVDGEDSFTESADTVVKNCTKDTKDGDIILIHDIHDWSVEATPQIIEKLQGEGFTFVTVTQLLTRNGESLHGGGSYRRYKNGEWE